MVFRLDSLDYQPPGPMIPQIRSHYQFEMIGGTLHGWRMTADHIGEMRPINVQPRSLDTFVIESDPDSE